MSSGFFLDQVFSSLPLRMISSNDVQLEEKIASGEFAEVWKGKWKGRTVAVKIPKIQSGVQSWEELVKLLQLKHQNVITAYGGYRSVNSDVVNILMEYVPRRVGDKDRNFQPTEMFDLLFDLARGLNYLHEDKGWIHGDIKLSNILVNGTYGDRINEFLRMDPSDASWLISDSLSKEQLGKRGNSFFIAPEISEGQSYTNSVDVYSYGKIIEKLTVGLKLNGGLSDFLTKLTLSCTRADPDSRAKMSQVLEELQKNQHLFPQSTRLKVPLTSPSPPSQPLSKERNLRNWAIEYHSDNKIGLMGTLDDGVVFHTSSILKGEGRKVKTSGGVVYNLQGSIDEKQCLLNTIPQEMIDKFRDGFPSSFADHIAKPTSKGKEEESDNEDNEDNEDKPVSKVTTDFKKQADENEELNIDQESSLDVEAIDDTPSPKKPRVDFETDTAQIPKATISQLKEIITIKGGKYKSKWRRDTLLLSAIDACARNEFSNYLARMNNDQLDIVCVDIGIKDVDKMNKEDRWLKWGKIQQFFKHL